MKKTKRFAKTFVGAFLLVHPFRINEVNPSILFKKQKGMKKPKRFTKTFVGVFLLVHPSGSTKLIPLINPLHQKSLINIPSLS
jgi:hypothetical protein